MDYTDSMFELIVGQIIHSFLLQGIAGLTLHSMQYVGVLADVER